jgi:DNA-binding NarL/FixJ family response regulator
VKAVWAPDATRATSSSGSTLVRIAPIIPSVPTQARVVIAEDDVFVREGVVSLLTRRGYDVVGQCGDPSELLALVTAEMPDVAVIDVRMPPTYSTEGLDAARVICEESPGTAILVLSAHVEIEDATDLIAGGGGRGYLLKARVTDVDEFVDALERVVNGGTVVDPVLVQELVAARRVRDPLAGLSPREREVLALMAEGRSNAGIAHKLFVAEGTVEKHIRSILMKLDIPETTEDHRRVLAVLAYVDTR